MFDKFQAKPSATIPLTGQAFENINGTEVYWLGAAGVLVNSHGTTIMMDPILTTWPGDEGRSEIGGMPLLAPPPILAEHVLKLDAVLYTHADGDHVGIETAKALLPSGAIFHTTPHAAEKLREAGIPRDRICEHIHHSVFYVGDIRVRMTGAFHPHQLGVPEQCHYFHFTIDDCTGFRLETQDGIIWNPGDTMLMEEHLSNKDADIVMMDFGDNEHHFGRRIATQLANALRWSRLIMFHWGTVYSPDQDCYNADPEKIRPNIINPDRLKVLAPGEALQL